MGMISTEAWVLHKGPPGAPPGQPGRFERSSYSFADINDEEVLAEPLYGCWEGNMTHAIARDPIDICRQRRENQVVLGNAGVVRVCQVGSSVKTFKEGDVAIVAPIGRTDRFGYLTKVVAYDAPNTMGLLAKRMKIHQSQLGIAPSNSRFSVKHWAAFSLRYATAWANWKVAYSCWRAQMPEHLLPTASVWAWGGGVALAELTLAKHFGCRVFMIASTDERLRAIERLGIHAIDRRRFQGLNYDEERYSTDRAYRSEYLANERTFLEIVRSNTDGLGASIFIDNIGRPVFRATLRALGRQGVVTTVGWKRGMALEVNRAVECIARHIHVYTHGASHCEGFAALQFAEETGWMPPVGNEVYHWDEMDELARDYGDERVQSYFPLFEVNPC